RILLILTDYLLDLTRHFRKLVGKIDSSLIEKVAEAIHHGEHQQHRKGGTYGSRDADPGEATNDGFKNEGAQNRSEDRDQYELCKIADRENGKQRERDLPDGGFAKLFVY